MRRLLLACFALLLIGVGCDDAGQPTWAAKVNGTEIPMTDVEDLALYFGQTPADPNAPASSTTTTAPFSLSGQSARDALSTFIRWDLIELQLADLGVEVTDEATTAAKEQVESQLGEAKIPASTKKRITEGLAAQLTFSAALVEQSDNEAINEVVDAFYASNQAGWADWLCLEGVAVPTADRATVDQMLAEAGATIESVASAGLPTVQPLFQTGVQGCFPAAELPEQLATVLDTTPDGQLVVQEQQAQSGDNVALFIRELGRKDIARDDPEVLSTMATALQGQDGQQWIDLALSATASKADIDILSTIGSGFDVETLTVTAPPKPKSDVTTTTTPLIPQSG